jgi:hypothetical protein
MKKLFAALIVIVLGIAAAWFLRNGNEPGTLAESELETVASVPRVSDGPAVGSTGAAIRTVELNTNGAPDLETPNQPDPDSARLEEDAQRTPVGPASGQDVDIVQGVSDAIDELFAAAFANDLERAQGVTQPGSAVAEQAMNLTEVTSELPDLPIDIYGGAGNALAVSWLANATQPSGNEEGYLVFTLKLDTSGTWLIEDIDFESRENTEQEIERFLEGHDGAALLTPARE